MTASLVRFPCRLSARRPGRPRPARCRGMAGGMLLLAGLLCAAPVAAAPRAHLMAQSTGEFDRPHDIVLSPDGRYLYVADVGHDVVRVLDARTLATLDQIGAGELDSPHDVAIDGEGRLLVADSGNDRIAVYRLEGTGGTLAAVFGEGDLDSPEGVAVAADGTIVVTNASDHNVMLYAGTRRAAVAGERGDEPGEYVRPHDVDVDREGLIYVTDPGNDRIQVLDRELRVREVLGGAGFDFNEPKYLAFDEANRLYVADEHNDVVKLFDTGRRLIATIPAPGDELVLNHPEGVTVRGGIVWIADTYNHRILRFRWEGLE